MRDVLQQIGFQAAARHAETAIWDAMGAVSYAELVAKTHIASQLLTDAGLRAGRLVALEGTMDRDLCATILGAWRLGGAFVLLDPRAPGRRQDAILADSGAIDGRTAVLRLRDEGVGEAQPDEAWRCAKRAAAYVMYTSGSTGKPKGVIVSHSALANYLGAAGATYLEDEGRAVSLTPDVFAFDMAITTVLLPLVSGGTMVVQDPAAGLRRPDAVPEPEGSCVLLAKWTPALLQAGAGSDSGSWGLKRRVIVIGGEALASSAALSDAVNGGATVVNEYGPTETTVGATVWRVDGVEGASIPIGVPIANTQVYVLDEAGARVPAGVQGELFIGGAGVAEGYLGRYDETARRFVPDPFSGIPGARMYRTGDIGWMRQDGVLEYVGRQDDQVKIRGYRVEVGEVEVAVAGCPGVQSAAVVAVADSARGVALHGFFAGEADQAAVRQHLIEMLPAYMVPGALTQIDRMPLTPNGKVDRAALRERAIPEAKVGHTAGVPPRTEAERLLCEIWKDVLGLDHEVSVTDNFFELGGDSILSIQVIARARRNGWALGVSAFFEAENLRDLALTLECGQVEHA